MSTPARLRNWAIIVRLNEGEIAHAHFCNQIANMLEGCAKREEEYKARIEELENE